MSLADTAICVGAAQPRQCRLMCEDSHSLLLQLDVPAQQSALMAHVAQCLIRNQFY